MRYCSLEPRGCDGRRNAHECRTAAPRSPDEATKTRALAAEVRRARHFPRSADGFFPRVVFGGAGAAARVLTLVLYDVCVVYFLV